MMTRLALAATLLITTLPGLARAAAVTCTLSGPTINMGNVSPLGTTAAYGSGNATVTCTAKNAATTVVACLEIGTGSGGLTASNRTLINGSNHLPVVISQTVGGTQIGDGTSYPLAGPITFSLAKKQSASQPIPIVFAFTPPVALPTGTYSSSFSGTSTGFQLFYASPQGTADCAAAQAGGNTASGTLSASAVVVNSCTVTATNLNFGTTGFLLTPISATASISVTCNATLTATIALNNGQYGTGPTTRQMALGAGRVTYGIYQDAAHSQPWGTTVGTDTEALPVASNTATAIAYGLVPAQASVAPGNYSDVVGVTVTY